FNSIDELTNVSGIGEVKLKAIKDENLACVEGNDEEEDVEEKEETVEEERIFEPAESSKNTIAFEENLVQEGEEPQKIQELQIIKLNSKDIKNNNSIQENKEKSLTAKYAGFGLMALCILLVILLFSKERKHGIQ
ncbi:MAG: hypothetical protein PHV68_09895, partial [Candidatus Gastranaerophilales bacterium]|nr:hypothetical protein [Candidatus Gastranaerophilales bacterium]